MMRSIGWVTLAFVLACSLAEAFEAGAAKVDITAPVGTPLNGYGDRMGRSSIAVHDPLWARALYLDDGQTKLFLVSLDLCAINPELRNRVLEIAPGIVPHDNIILAATHTHSGQGAMCKSLPIRAVSGRFIPEVLESTAQGIVKAMTSAYDNRKRGAIGYGVGRQDSLSANRREPGGPIDEQIGVILVTDADGNTMSVVTNFAGHPTSVPDSDQYSFSADYVGYYYDEMEKNSSPGCVAMFLNGAEGNQTIGNPESKEGWARTESVGRLLAARVKEIMGGIACGEAALRLSRNTPALPRTLASAFQPASTIVQTLEINDLLVAFFPGEACVELALELRDRAQARGYTEQFSVGLANDYLMYFIPRKFYAQATYESAMNFFGPGIEDWFYREFGKLMTRGTPDPEFNPGPAVSPEQIAGGLHLVLQGSPYAMGLQRGKAFGDDLRARYQRRVVTPVQSGAWQPETGMWSYWPSFLDPLPLALPVMAMAARPMLEGVPESLILEMEGLAEGAGLPFDAVWLLQNAGRLESLDNKDALFNTPLCTFFAAAGDRAGADDLLVGRNLDWADPEQPVVIEMHPDQGHGFVQAGFGWNTGVFTGMNDAGLVLCMEQAAALPEKELKGAAIELLLRELLQTMDDPDQVVEFLRARNRFPGCHVLVAGIKNIPPPAASNGKNGLKKNGVKNGLMTDPAPLMGGPRAYVVEFGAQITVREPVEGLLLGSVPEAADVAPDSKTRYTRVLNLLQYERIIGPKEIKKTLADAEEGQAPSACIWNTCTRHSVVFEPKNRTMHVAFPDPSGVPGAYTTFSLNAGGRP
ncbi:MAG TPA: neutral/alkaline non-lysosomal ceramidase N-terminal domain-containing protein [Candidatus Hydrogenedentes bacterium]|nr:neutral/alkaline non-lysosomal ceramidase N-terminal domain-containing protein [Candidatus Hydrogenedentota bacterium]